jgi:hypothetical protein
MRDLVTWMVDNMPSNAVVQENQNETQNCRPSCHENSPSVSIHIKQIHNPSVASPGSVLSRTFSWEVGRAIFSAAGIGGSKGIWDVDLFDRNIFKDRVLQYRHHNNRNSNGKVRDNRSDIVIAAKG